MKLYHTGFKETIKKDLYIGRKNADFGQGFYLSPDFSFSSRWASSFKDKNTIMNIYVYGVITSGYLTSSQSLRILKIGNEYTQVVLKSPKAIDNLKFISSNIISSQDIESNYRAYYFN
jgi:hypothetical protein